MSRNLIAAKAWENGREKSCSQCEFFGIAGEVQRYGWDNCQKSTTGLDHDDFSKWDGDNCHYFKSKKGLSFRPSTQE